MLLRKTGLTIALTLLLLTVWSLLALAALEYRDRGDRYEGVKSSEVRAFDIVLLSAVVDFGEAPPQAMPARLKLKFYLEQPSKVFVIVRELVNRYYYWLDDVRPKKSWQAGFDNNFEWPTSEVLQQLNDIRVGELGVVVRLGHESPRANERVAPAIFYYSQPPRTIERYRFTFKTNGHAQVTCSVYREGVDKPISSPDCGPASAGRPFPVHWESSGAERGWYQLQVKGSFEKTKRRVMQSVHFYHQPVVE
ncbi:MAG: hypothetical protein ACRERE_13365 [Candidatus Entotheonellia bacterium]